MNVILNILVWLLAAAPLLAAGYWATFASRLPQSRLDRQALMDVSSAWQWERVADFVDEPFHVIGRAVHLGALHVPSATLASVVWLNVLLVALLAIGLTGLCRRAFPRVDPRIALFAFGLLVASPAFGSNWIHGERAAVLLLPVLFVAALYWLQGERRFVGRMLLVLLVAIAAPLVHTHGIAVTVALVPATMASARRAGSARLIAWLGTLLLFGVIAAILSLRSADALGPAGLDWFRSIGSAPVDTLQACVQAIGRTWLDLLPAIKIDELGLGLVTLALPLVVWLFGSRDREQRLASMPWWSCYLMGLSIVLLAAVRYQLAPPVGSLREATFGSFLLPVGVIGVLAARCSQVWLTYGVGMLSVLAAQDWHQGLEDLRLARMHVEAQQAALLLPSYAEAPSTPATSPFEQLRERGWVSAQDFDEAGLLPTFAGASDARHGVCHGGGPGHLRGSLRSSLRLDTSHWLFALASENGEVRVVGDQQPKFSRRGRDVDWRVDWSEALAEGAKVRAVALVLPSRKFVPVGPVFVVKDGTLVAEN